MDTVVAPPIPNTGLVPQAASVNLSQTSPNNSIYINNLNEKIKRDDLKKSLFAVFVQFGKILDIITAKNLKMKGQAFVVFDEINSATMALRAMQGFPLYEKPMRIQYARKDSDLISKRKGTFQPRPYQLIKRDKDANQIELSNDALSGLSARAIRRRQQKITNAQENVSNNGHVTTVVPPPMAINPLNIPDQPPNKILFLTNLPDDSNEPMISMLFTQFTGFKEVRMVPGRHDIAFVEFDNENQAGVAKNGLQGFNIQPNKPVKITFAKK